MITILKRNIATLFGAFVGAGIGYLYWIQVQESGFAADTNPFVCSIWGAIIVSSLVLMLKREMDA